MYYSHKVVYISNTNGVGETLCQNKALATACEEKLLQKGFTTSVIKLKGVPCQS